ncbi:FeoA family protein [Methanoculleus chikugoensis]|uniref:FeoA family protein n=1 Tax=Methanoculleus chikugoensis TaxID=118126 RepID=UPI00094595EA|nr:FeoA family protein [Methanoculleus chikugoensis]MDD4566798.1 FeoA family protein [Methanoculleus chikugoensis]NMA09725.1 ferrous iron transport protein A [Methanomicrobiales archaeon]
MQPADPAPNERARVVGVEGGQCRFRHLALEGLAGGCIVTGLSGRFDPVVVRISDETHVLGRGTAQKIQVRAV